MRSKFTHFFLIPATVLGLFSCSEPRNPDAVEIPKPGTPLFFMPAASSPGAAGNAGARVNPAHGQPGHSCAIPVGAPLPGAATPPAPAAASSMPALPGSPAPVAAPPAPAPTPAPAPAPAAPGMNPAHGQPGHSCSVPVGAPLPKNGTASTQPAINVQPTVTPTPEKVAPGMNPPHGQPGHSCSVAVGAPLPKN